MGMGRGMRPPGSTAPRTGIEAGPASSAIYVPLALAKHFTRGKAKINLINIQLKPEAKSQIAEFRKTWEARIAKTRPAASMLGVDDIKTGIEEGMMASRAKQEAWAATGLSLLAALFIIFTTLSMGVTERVRQFAVMRAVGLTRGQVAQVIAIEGVILALIGWGGGLLAGWGLLAVVSQHADRPVPQRRVAGHVVHRLHRPERVRRRAGGVDPAGVASHERRNRWRPCRRGARRGPTCSGPRRSASPAWR